MSSLGEKGRNAVTLRDILGHFNIVGMAIAFAVGVAGKDLILSMSDNLVIPGLLHLLMRDDSLFHWNPKQVLANMSTFVVVLGVTLLLLQTVLRPLVLPDVVDTQILRANRRRKYSNSA
jgi:large-conductance mechanosensitive channel